MGLKAIIFDLDGVITKTALVHSRAWKEMFDDYLLERKNKYGEKFREFTHEGDYLNYVDGKPRYEGVRSFLESRGIELDFGNPSDPSEKETICGIGNRKNAAFNEILERDGVEVYPSTVRLMKQLRERGIRLGVASSSKNCEKVLKAAGLMELVETRVDGVVSAELGLKGKPGADIFTTAADNLGVEYHDAVVVEDAISGVQAGRNGNFGLVLGLAREDNEQSLLANGADIAVRDISEIGLEGILNWFEEGMEKDSWKISYHDYDPGKERSREAILSVGNGYFGSRGAMEEMGINEVNYPATYMAGVYNRLVSEVGGRDVENEDFVNVSNWLPVSFAINGDDYIDLNSTRILEVHRRLDLQGGILQREMVVEDEKGRRTRIRSRRFASMDKPQLAGLEYTLIPLNYSGHISLRSMLTAYHINDGVKRYAELEQQHLKPENGWTSGNIQGLEVKTTQSDISIRQLAKLEVSLDGRMYFPEYEAYSGEGFSSLAFRVPIAQGSGLSLQKCVYIDNDLHPAFREENPLDMLHNAGSFGEMLDNSVKAWRSIWERIDIKLSGDRQSQKLLRLHLYHLVCTASPHNTRIDFGIPARGLTGEAYRGHIFWDELYILPVFFLHYPEVARSILMYRYRRLDEARRYAKDHGYKGAMFPWQSGSSGREETQKYHYNPVSGKWGDDHSSRQRHVNLAIAYNVLNYHHTSGDEEFIKEYGMEMLVEICRLWASMARKNGKSGRWSIAGVMGPDEFHEHLAGREEGGLKDNAYTNVMTAWLFHEVSGLLKAMDEKERQVVMDRLSLEREEIEGWKAIGSQLRLVIEGDIIAQFDGYFELDEIDWEHYRKEYRNIYRMDRILKAEGKSPDDYKVAKQADTLMLFYNLDKEIADGIIRDLGYSLSADYAEKNFYYYLRRTSHGSTLSRVVHAYLAHTLGMKELAWELYMQALGSDLNDIQGGTTAEGIHTGVMAGTVMIALNAYAGLNTRGELLSLNPDLPTEWKGMEFSLRFKDREYRLSLDAEKTVVEVDEEVQIRFKGDVVALEKGRNELKG